MNIPKKRPNNDSCVWEATVSGHQKRAVSDDVSPLTRPVQPTVHFGKQNPLFAAVFHGVGDQIFWRFYTLVNLAIRAAKIPHMVLNSDTKVRLEAQKRFVYPDLTITDGQPEYYRNPEGALRRDIITNPLLIVEVLSEDTRAFDKSEKFEAYAAIPGFREYILLEPETVWVKQYFLQDPSNNLWQINTFTDTKARLALQSVNLELALEDLYSVLEKLPKDAE